MPSGEKRPASADTMLLVLKPREENYKQVAAQMYGTENERLAYRKNRVIQMKLGTYLAEVCLQEKSAALILKNEEHRFLQKVSKRSTTPPSVRMLQELNRFMQKTFANTAEGKPVIRNVYSQPVDFKQSCYKDEELSSNNVHMPSDPNKLPSALSPRKRPVVLADKTFLKETVHKKDTLGLELHLPSIERTYKESQELHYVATLDPSESLNDEVFHDVTAQLDFVLPNITDESSDLNVSELNDASSDVKHSNRKTTDVLKLIDQRLEETHPQFSKGNFSSKKAPLVRRNKTSELREHKAMDKIATNDMSQQINVTL
ncbi:uncharacterized protein LOC106056472 [Biomphalaria glabrata]|uniref:Uncharacterized protein LOC106056472 n=1 Tax=Biomphalaria glabrata TaxID=6526 RepID=A0A9U8E120_BIOGL|nr:uncharacterized protein LOC106056472 [Biomphalaria glabrata]XP_013068709.2 uncharacterized protein LOC106056472 [Biomphalaria glabrata]